MGRRGSDLAARFRNALDSAEVERRRKDEERQRRLSAGRKEREELLQDLTDFGEAIGYVAVQQHDGGVTFRHNDRFLHFEPMGEGDRVRITFDDVGDDEHRLYREEGLDLKWVWAMRRRGREDRLPLFDNGLEELMILALKLPRPGDGAPPALAGPTLDDAVPRSTKPDEPADGGKRSL